tara:strand:+ start:112 stop:891 length:780 start_codon:yes stop_codon:yes gene_type:complete
MDKTLGFIILRHVKDTQSSKFWILSHQSIRKFYKDNKIIIIDDNSDYSFIDEDYQNSLENTSIIKSQFPKRAELLPFYYYSKNKFFDIAVIVQDSVFINSKIDFYTNKFKFLWHITSHQWDYPEKEREIISSLKNNENILKLHRSKLWRGCFGSMVSINYNFLKKIDDKHSLSNMLNIVMCRYDRIAFERVIACILLSDGFSQTLEKSNNRKFIYKNCKELNNNISYTGDIIGYCKYRSRFEEIEKLKHLPIIKIWYDR